MKIKLIYKTLNLKKKIINQVKMKMKYIIYIYKKLINLKKILIKMMKIKIKYLIIN